MCICNTKQVKHRAFVTQGSLTDGPCDLLINASNTSMTLGSGVSGAIRIACGAGYQSYLDEELLAHRGGVLQPGQVLFTNAGQHPRARYVAHAAVMDYRNGFTGLSYPTLELVEQAYIRIWEGIATLGESGLSVAVVALGAGTGNLGARDPIELACRTLRPFLSGENRAAFGDLHFFGYILPEYIAMVEVVSQHFEIPPDTVPPEIVKHISATARIDDIAE